MSETALNGVHGFEIDLVHLDLFSSSTKRRTSRLHALKDEISANELSAKETKQAFELLTTTYPFYVDRQSREAVRDCLEALLASSNGEIFTGLLIQYLQKEGTKVVVAASSSLVLTEWAALLEVYLSKVPELIEKHWVPLIKAHATVLERCIGSTNRSSIKSAALVVSRRGIRSVFRNRDVAASVVKSTITTLTSKEKQPNPGNALLLGVVAGVCSRLYHAEPILREMSSEYYAFFTRELIGSKGVVPTHVANGLRDFFECFVVQEALEAELGPSLEKGMLRAPETVLNDLISPIVTALPEDMDLSMLLKNHLLKGLLSNTKSTNEAIRDGSMRVFMKVLDRCHDESVLVAVVDEVIKAFKDAKTPEQRLALGQILLQAIPTNTAVPKLIPGLLPYVTKETNEAALNSLLAPLSRVVLHTLSNKTDIDPSTVKAFQQGLADKKPSIRRLWAAAAGRIGLDLKTDCASAEASSKFFEPLLQKMLVSWEEVIANPLPAGQSGLVTVAYVLFVLSQSQLHESRSSGIQQLLKKVNAEKSIISTDKPSFILSSRVYTKFTDQTDLTWYTRALYACSGRVLSVKAVSKLPALDWTQAAIYLVVAVHLPYQSRSFASQALEQAFLQHSENLPGLIVSGLWEWLKNLNNEEKDTAAMLSKADPHSLVRFIDTLVSASRDVANDNDSAVLRDLLVRILVLCRSPLIPGMEWIQTCLSAGVDPQTLVVERKEECMSEIIEHTLSGSDSYSQITHRAACNAAAELAFVAPESIIPTLVGLIIADLDPKQFNSIGPTEAAIWRTPEGVTFVDVLGAKPDSQVLDKKTKDYDTLKWEQELRAQLAQKQSQQKKLTADEQAKVKAQLAKEAEIRQHVANVDQKLRRGIGIVASLSHGPTTNAESWIGPAVHALAQSIKAGARLLVGDAAALAYLACSDQVTSRLGSFRQSIGVATLRAQQASQLPDELQAEQLGDLVTRVLYRLRFTSEGRPYDVVSFSYMLPLVDVVLEEGGIAKTEAEEKDEQITLALEFLSFHVDLFSISQLPRLNMSSLLISSLRRFNQHYKLLKENLLGICRALAPDATTEEIQTYLAGSIVPESSVRNCVLQAIDEELSLDEGKFYVEIWLASHDVDEENAELGNSIWEENSLTTFEDSHSAIIPYLESKDSQLRRAAAKSLASYVESHKNTFSVILDSLEKLYSEKAIPPKPEKDAYGMPIKKDMTDPWEARHGIGLAFNDLTPGFQIEAIEPFIRFMIESGPFSDKNPTTRDAMVTASTALISQRAAAKVEELLKMFEATLEAPNADSKEQDLTNEAVIIMYGSVARHLKAGDARVVKVVKRLLSTLNTPSETVQYAIAECLPPLVRSSAAEAPEYIDIILKELLEGKKYAGRRGAAYGLAGIIRGKGVLGLREHRLLSTLKGATEDKKDPNRRQGAFLAFELLSLVLGPMFEPYTIQIVPQLLAGFADPSADVREACLDAAKTCFAALSSYGVSQILPTLLEGLDDTQWRSKKGACDSLGAMAYLDPQQLALSLPQIIPPLTTVLTDSHKEVRASANRSLQRFGDVIGNPEVKSVVNILLKALSDPTKHTEEALIALLKIQFMHYLDAPSLALVVRILERGLGDRSSTKQKAAQIIGSLAHLTERKDLVSQLPILVKGLRVAAIDPVPTTRATASKALGSLVEKLGEDAMPDLIPSLMSTLKTDTGAGDRLGSAQALSEVLAGLGIQRLEDTLPSILQNVQSAKAAVREGFMSLFIFLPACFGNSFANYLSKIIPPILAGLADEVDSIRETSLRAGRLLVKNFAARAIDLLLPELQRGLADENYRIRLSSVELVGDLLFNLTGISGKVEQDGEVDEDAIASGPSLVEVLGEERRDNILSALYISRCDTSGLVRSSAMAVWKALVATPRTLREITPTLTQVIIRRLASTNMEQKVIASNALGELIRKAGDGVLNSLLPTLEQGLQTSIDRDAKQGICIAVRELIGSSNPDSLEDHESKLVAIVKTALIDSDEDVRDAAAEAFDSMQRLFGKRVIDQILPNLLTLLRQPDEADSALAALLTLLTDATRSNIILPNLLPTLLTSPISTFNARALASLASVAGSAMTRRLGQVLNSLTDNIIASKDEEQIAALEGAFDAVLLSMDEFDGLNAVMSIMLGLVKVDDHRKRINADYRLQNFFTTTEVDYSRYHPDLVRALLISFDDRDEGVVKATWAALSTLTSKLSKEEMESLVIPTRQVLAQVGTSGHPLPGFLLPKGINAILPIFLQGLINGTPDERTQAALAISEIIDKSSADSLKPFVTQITGPLIRVVSERSVEVKAAILLTLNNLLEKIPTFLRPFLPQLQRTFTKSLADTSSEILRTRAAKALGTLITLTPRIDPLIGELVTGSKTSDPGVKNAMQKALYEVVSKVGANMSETSRGAIIGLIDEENAQADDAMAISNARLLGALIKNLSADVASNLVKTRVLTPQFTRSSVLALNSILLESPTTLTQNFNDETVSTICKGLGKPETFVVENCVLAAGKYLLSPFIEEERTFVVARPIYEALVPVIQPGTPIDARRLALVVIRTISRAENDAVRPHLALLVPPVFGNVRDPVIPIKLSAEAALIGLFDVMDEEAAVFDKYMASPAGSALAANTKRSMNDYFKRVALRLGAQARERRDAEGGAGGLGLTSDEREDEREIWSVGKVDLGEGTFSEE